MRGPRPKSPCTTCGQLTWAKGGVCHSCKKANQEIQSLPPPPKKLTVELSFEGREEEYRLLQRVAKRNIRTIEEQALYSILRYMGQYLNSKTLREEEDDVKKDCNGNGD